MDGYMVYLVVKPSRSVIYAKNISDVHVLFTASAIGTFHHGQTSANRTKPGPSFQL